jgi:hypothetical protein
MAAILTALLPVKFSVEDATFKAELEELDIAPQLAEIALQGA